MWNPLLNTEAENERWSQLRAIEWGSFPGFLSPLFGPIIVLLLGWITLIVLLFILNIPWKLFFVRKPNLQILNFFTLPVNILKWPLGIIFALIAWSLHRSPIFIISLAAFPLISYFFVILELPLSPFIKTPGVGDLQKIILRKMGYSFDG